MSIPHQPFIKWYPTDWRADPRLRMCSLAARGLWIELIGYMHEGEPYGHLTINGLSPAIGDIASLVGRPLAEVRKAMGELEQRQVYSVDDEGRMFSRRMVRDKAKAEKDRENGKGGGNPKLKGGVNPPDKAHIPEARDQKPSPEKQETRVTARSDDWPGDHADLFWQAYPRKTEKLAAMKKLATLRKSGIVTFADLIAGVKRYAASVANTDPKYVKQPTTWLNAGCWADEIPEGGFNGHATSNNRTNQTSGSAPTRDTAIIAGMGRALEKRRAARAATDGGRQEFREERGFGPAARADAEPPAAAGDDGAPRQFAFLPVRNAGA